MRILQFKVTGQNLSKDGDFSGIVAGTKGYLHTEYNFDSEWDGCKKAAVFFQIRQGISCPDCEWQMCRTGRNHGI